MPQKSHFFNIYQDKRWMTFSNILTASRIALAPCIIVSIMSQSWYFSFYLFVYAAATDFFDGYIARLFQDQTYLGKILDPIADKIFLIASFGSLAWLPSPLFHIPNWFITLIFIREIIILMGACLVARYSPTLAIRPTMLGKATTFFELFFIMWLFVQYFLQLHLDKTNSITLFCLAIFAIISLGQYIFIGMQTLTNRTTH